MVRSIGLALVAAAFAFATPVQAQNAQIGKIHIKHAWARASIINVGAAYLTLHNMGSQPDQLIAVATPIAAKAQMHTHMMHNGIAMMRRVKAVEVAPGTPTVFKPGGLHIMLMKLKQPLKKGGTIPLTLTFAKAGKVTIHAKILKAGASGMQHKNHKKASDKKHSH